MPSLFRNVSASLATMTRAQSQRQASAPPILETPNRSSINHAPLTQHEINMLAPPRLTRQVAQVLSFDDEYVSEFDVGTNLEFADI